MMDDEAKAKFDQQTKEQYAQFGRFMVEFERVCGSIRSGIVFTLHLHGLKTQ